MRRGTPGTPTAGGGGCARLKPREKGQETGIYG